MTTLVCQVRFPQLVSEKTSSRQLVNRSVDPPCCRRVCSIDSLEHDRCVGLLSNILGLPNSFHCPYSHVLGSGKRRGLFPTYADLAALSPTSATLTSSLTLFESFSFSTSDEEVTKKRSRW
jgi:hypothetical protein